MAVPTAARLEFAFDQSEGDISRDGENLVLSFADGATLTLEGFYGAFAPDMTPPLIVAQGRELPGEEFLAALGNPDLMPAAGPAGMTPGGGSYADAQLAGVGGVTSLGKMVFDAAAPDPTEEPEAVEGVSALAASASGIAAAPLPAGPGAGGDPEPPYVSVTPPYVPPVEPPVTPPYVPPVEPPVIPPAVRTYEARAVVYAPDPSDYHAAQFRLLDFSGDSASVLNDAALAAAALDGLTQQNNYFSGFYYDAYRGVVTASLNEAGRAALALLDGDQNLYEYITFSVGGSEYTMQVVVNRDGNFDSKTEDGKLTPTGGALAWGEWHSESSQSSGTGFRASSGLNDELWLNTAGGGLHTGDGADSVTVTGSTGMSAKSAIMTGDGADSVTVTGYTTGMREGSAIATGEGKDTVTVKGGGHSGHYGMSGGSITDSGGEGNAITVTGGDIGMEGGSAIMTGEGADTITVTGGQNGSLAQSSNTGMKASTITDSGGDNTITVTSSMVGMSAGSEITTGDGADSVTVTGGNTGMSGGSEITTGKGADTITVKGVSHTGMSASAITAAGDGGNEIIVTGGNTGMSGGSEITTGKGADTITVKGVSGTGMSESTITDAGGDNTITVTARTTGMNANSAITTGEEKDTITVTGGVGGTYSYYYGMSGSSITDAGGEGNEITIKSGNIGMGVGSAITTGKGADTITVTGGVGVTGSAYSRYYGMSESSITDAGGDGNTITVEGGMTGMNAKSAITTGEGADTITVTGGAALGHNSHYSHGMSDSSITAGGGDNTITVTGSNTGMSAKSAITTGTGADTITVTSGGGAAVNSVGMDAGSITDSGGDNTITVSASSIGYSGHGMYNSVIKTSTERAGNDEITVKGHSGSGIASSHIDTGMDAGDTVRIDARSAVSNSFISAEKGTVILTSGAVSPGNVCVTTSGTDEETTIVGDTVILAASAGNAQNDSTNPTSGIWNTGGKTEITGNSVTIAAGYRLDADDNTMTIASGGADVTGIRASHSNSAETRVEGERVDVSVYGAGTAKAYAMDAANGGKNVIASGKVAITAESAAGGDAEAGMYAGYGGGTNTIQSKDGAALELEITADHAMWSSAGVNQIIGHSAGDSITINGKVLADASEGSGDNVIKTGGGDDRLIINGALEAGDRYLNPTFWYKSENSIDMGAGNDSVHLAGAVSGGGVNEVKSGDGDDSIRLSGKIEAGSLTLLAGEGHDTLILEAKDSASLQGNFQTLFNNNTGLENMDVESIRVDVKADDGGAQWLETVVTEYNAAHSDDKIAFAYQSQEGGNTVLRGGSEMDDLLSGTADSADIFAWARLDGTTDTIRNFTWEQGGAKNDSLRLEEFFGGDQELHSLLNSVAWNGEKFEAHNAAGQSIALSLSDAAATLTVNDGQHSQSVVMDYHAGFHQPDFGHDAQAAAAMLQEIVKVSG